MYKKFISIVLVLHMMFALSTALAVGSVSNFKKVNTYQSGLFTDVGAGVWFEESVKNSYEFDLMTGVSDHTFCPNDNITLAQAVVMAVRLHCIYNNIAQEFGQNGGAWYSGCVDFAKETGILTQDYTNYNRTATRAEFAAILAHAFPETALETINQIAADEIPDVATTHAYAKEILLLYRAGILSGSANSRAFRPSDSIQRAEAASIVTRMALPDKRVKLDSSTVSATVNTDSASSGKVILLAFWGSGIDQGLSDKEIDHLAAHLGAVDQIYKEYVDNSRVEVLAMNVGDSQQTLQKFIDRYMEQYHYELPVNTKDGEDILQSLDIDALPCLVFMNEKGQAIAPILAGVATYDDLKTILEALLAS